MTTTKDLAPRRVHALGLTYRDHIAETGEKISAEGPVVFQRDPASLVKDGDVLRVPSSTAILQALERLERGLGMKLRAKHPDVPALLDYEVELGLLLLEDISKERLDDPKFHPSVSALLANDITVRTVQILGEGSPNRIAFWSASKSFAGTLVVGPTLWTPPAGALDVPLSLSVNGVVRQRSSTKELLYTPRELLRFVARESDLRAGDLVLTGTPGGIALSVQKWKRTIADLFLSRFGKLSAAIRSSRGKGSRFLRHGDVLEMDGGPLGNLRVRVEDAAP